MSIPIGTPVASIILSSVNLELQREHGGDYLLVTGWGILAPDVVIPNEWWDRPRLITHMQADPPKAAENGTLVIHFSGHCDHVNELHKIYMSGVREDIEREIVPPVLIAMGMMRDVMGKPMPLPPVSWPFGTPVELEETIGLDEISPGIWPGPGLPPRISVEEAAKLVDAQYYNDLLLTKTGKNGGKELVSPKEANPVIKRRARVRIIDI